MGVNHIDGLSRTTDNREQPILSIDFFETDYYTHKIIGRLLDKIQFDSSLVQRTWKDYIVGQEIHLELV